MSQIIEQIETVCEVEVATSESNGNDENIEEDEENFFQDVHLLSHHKISIEDIEKMKMQGLNTIKGIQMLTKHKLKQLCKFSEETILKIQSACKAITTNNQLVTALEVFEERKCIFSISTGSENLDKLLGGGMQSMSVTEVFGESRTGKTQLAHTLCVTAQLPSSDGYNGGKVIFIDTENTFRPGRIRDIARRFQLDDKSVLQNILYARAYNSDHQYELLNTICAKFHEEPGVFKLLIIDSIMALLRVDYCGRGELAERQQKLNAIMARLQNISEEYNIAVFITNQITADFKLNFLDLTEVPKPTGGNILAHASTTRIALKKVMGNARIAVMYDSPELEEQEVAFIITGGGIRDPKID